MKTMKVIDLINEIHKNKIADGTKFYINFENCMRRACYYNKNGENGFIYQLSDNEPCQDFISFEDEVEFIEDKPKFEIDAEGFINTNSGAWKGRKMDIEFVKAINYLLEKSDK